MVGRFEVQLVKAGLIKLAMTRGTLVNAPHHAVPQTAQEGGKMETSRLQVVMPEV